MNKTIHISVDAAELIDSLQWEIPRNDVGPHGARGTIGNNGVLILRMNDHPVVSLAVHEDERGKLVVSVHKGIGDAIARVYPEEDGYVPPRTRKVRTA